MTSPISSATPVAHPLPASSTNASSKVASTRSVASVDSDGDHDGSGTSAAEKTKVTISAAGQAAVAANQEATETPAQTAQEAQGSDMQAKHLMAKEMAMAKAAQG